MRISGWLLPMNYQLLQWMKETFIGDDFEDSFILQDFILPIQHIKEAITLNDSLTGIYPVWLVPSRYDSIKIDHFDIQICNILCRLYLPQIPESALPRAGDVMHVDVGVYGHSKLENFVGREKALRTFEKFTLEHKGYQALYAETLMSFKEFTEMFPRECYDLVSI